MSFVPAQFLSSRVYSRAAGRCRLLNYSPTRGGGRLKDSTATNFNPRSVIAAPRTLCLALYGGFSLLREEVSVVFCSQSLMELSLLILGLKLLGSL